MVFKRKDDHTPLVLDFMKDRECLWNKKSEHSRNKTGRENALKEIVQELDFPNLTVEDLKLKIKTIRSRYAAELGKVIKSDKSGAGLHDIYVPKIVLQTFPCGF
jgi:hypothetical protein